MGNLDDMGNLEDMGNLDDMGNHDDMGNLEDMGNLNDMCNLDDMRNLDDMGKLDEMCNLDDMGNLDNMGNHFIAIPIFLFLSGSAETKFGCEFIMSLDDIRALATVSSLFHLSLLRYLSKRVSFLHIGVIQHLRLC